MSEDQESLRAIDELLREVRAKLGADGRFRLRVLLDMLTIELTREMAGGERRGEGRGASRD